MEYFDKKVFMKQIKKDFKSLQEKVTHEKEDLLGRIKTHKVAQNFQARRENLRTLYADFKKNAERLGINVEGIEQRANKGLDFVQQATKGRIGNGATATKTTKGKGKRRQSREPMEKSA